MRQRVALSQVRGIGFVFTIAARDGLPTATLTGAPVWLTAAAVGRRSPRRDARRADESRG